VSYVNDTVIKGNIFTEIDIAFKAKIGCIYKFFAGGFIRQDIAEIVMGIEEAFYSAKGAAYETIRFIHFNGSAALGASMLYSKAHVNL